MDTGKGNDGSSTGNADQDIQYNEAVAFQGDMNLSITNANFHIETMPSETDENSKDESFAADFVADQPEVPAAAQSVNRAVFMRNTSANPSVCHLQNATINVVAGSGGGRAKRRQEREQRRSEKRGANQTHNYAALVRNTGSSAANVKIVGASINICAGSNSSGGHSEAIGIDGAGNLNVVDGTINIVTGGNVKTEDVEE